jgi:hypothetical protein
MSLGGLVSADPWRLHLLQEGSYCLDPCRLRRMRDEQCLPSARGMMAVLKCSSVSWKTEMESKCGLWGSETGLGILGYMDSSTARKLVTTMM